MLNFSTSVKSVNFKRIPLYKNKKFQTPKMQSIPKRNAVVFTSLSHEIQEFKESWKFTTFNKKMTGKVFLQIWKALHISTRHGRQEGAQDSFLSFVLFL